MLDRLLGLDAEKVREQTNLRYLRDADEAVDQVRRGEADVAFLTNPVTMEQLREVAFAGEVMPQKSTDFYPKLLSGSGHLCAGVIWSRCRVSPCRRSRHSQEQQRPLRPTAAQQAPPARFVVVLDAAHGGDDPGGRLANGQLEKARLLP